MRTATLLMASAAAALYAMPAHAQNLQDADATQAMAVSGNVPEACTIGAPTLSPSVQQNFRGLDGNLLQVDQLVDPVTLSTRAASVELVFASFCQTAHRLIIESRNNGLFREPGSVAPPAPGFGYAVPYLATAQWGAQVLQLRADASTRRIHEDWIGAGPTHGDLKLRLDIAAGATNDRFNSPLVAGLYSDTLRITLEPRQ